ncbi:hypothetical protein VTK56DRAFT_2783 [Thermocarpiscus australiensis]
MAHLRPVLKTKHTKQPHQSLSYTSSTPGCYEYNLPLHPFTLPHHPHLETRKSYPNLTKLTHLRSLHIHPLPPRLLRTSSSRPEDDPHDGAEQDHADQAGERAEQLQRAARGGAGRQRHKLEELVHLVQVLLLLDVVARGPGDGLAVAQHLRALVARLLLLLLLLLLFLVLVLSVLLSWCWWAGGGGLAGRDGCVAWLGAFLDGVQFLVGGVIGLFLLLMLFTRRGVGVGVGAHGD